MNSTPTPAGLAKSATAKQLGDTVTSALTAADSTSADRIQTLSLINQARVSRLTRTAASATAQYGASSTQATAAQAAVTAGQASVARIQVLHQQVATPVPPVAATGWALHGRVYNSNLQPVLGYTVFLVDSQKTYQEVYGFAYTDSTGYFLINHPGATAIPTPTNGSAAPAAESASLPTPAPTAPAPAAASSSPLFVEIANPAALPVYLRATAWSPITGSASYQSITLPAGEPPLGDPPDAIRKVALPPPTGSPK